jgi:hypothetical protein
MPPAHADRNHLIRLIHLIHLMHAHADRNQGVAMLRGRRPAAFDKQASGEWLDKNMPAACRSTVRQEKKRAARARAQSDGARAAAGESKGQGRSAGGGGGATESEEEEEEEAAAQQRATQSGRQYRCGSCCVIFGGRFD